MTRSDPNCPSGLPTCCRRRLAPFSRTRNPFASNAPALVVITNRPLVTATGVARARKEATNSATGAASTAYRWPICRGFSTNLQSRRGPLPASLGTTARVTTPCLALREGSATPRASRGRPCRCRTGSWPAPYIQFPLFGFAKIKSDGFESHIPEVRMA